MGEINLKRWKAHQRTEMTSKGTIQASSNPLKKKEGKIKTSS